MTPPLSVLAIAGSLRRGSHNRALLLEASRLAPDAIELDLYDGLAAVPPYDQDAESRPGEAVLDLRRRIAAADALLIATPEYNGSIPGVLKNAVDWASRPLGLAALLGKPVAVISASTGQFGAAWAQAELRKSLGIAGARVLGLELAVSSAPSRFDEAGRLEPELADALRGVLAGLIDLAADVEAERLGEEAEDAIAAA